MNINPIPTLRPVGELLQNNTDLMWYNNNGFNNTIPTPVNSIINNMELSNKISNLQHSFNAYKNDLIYTKELDDNFNEEDIQEILDKDLIFLQSVIDVKKRISILKLKYKAISEETVLVKEYIKKLENLMGKLVESNKEYNDLLFLVSKELNPKKGLNDVRADDIVEKQKNTITELLLHNKHICVDNDDKCCNIIEKIRMLQQIICTKDIENIDKDESENKDSGEPTPETVLCSICIGKNIEYCVIPCGHCFCKGCTNKITDKCHSCRGIIKEKIKIFYN